MDTCIKPCFCTLAIHEPYRRRARLLVSDVPDFPWTVLTDRPADFADLPVLALQHEPTGPMAADYLERLEPTGRRRGAAAYHDKRFVLQAALEGYETAIFLDADTRFNATPPAVTLPFGLCTTPVVQRSIVDHLKTSGSWRLSAFVALATELAGDADVLEEARWCHETCLAIRKDGKEKRFFEAWDRGARLMQGMEVFSGEGGVLGLAAYCAGWSVDYDALQPVAKLVVHEGGGPKEE